MVNIASTYASNLGQLILNLTGRGYMIKLQTERGLFNKDVLYIQVSDLRKQKSLRHAITEMDLAEVSDVGTIADVIAERLKLS